MKKIGGKWRLYVNDPDTVINGLVEFAGKKNTKIVSLNTLAPTLEDVFLRFLRKEEGRLYD